MKITELRKFKKRGYPDNGPYPVISDSGSRFWEVFSKALEKYQGSTTHTVLFYLGENNKILAAQHIADIDFEAFDLDAVKEKATAHQSQNLYIMHNPEKLQEEEYIWTPIPGTNRSTQTTALTGLTGNSKEIRQLLVLSDRLKKKGLSVIDVVMHDENAFMPYSRYVSGQIFPGLHCNIDWEERNGLKSGNAKLLTFAQHQRAFKGVRNLANEKYKHYPHHPVGCAFAVETEYGGYYNVYQMPISHYMQIPGFCEGCGFMPEKIFQQLMREQRVMGDKKNVLTFVLDKQQQDSLQPSEMELAFATEARVLSEKYKVPVKEIILLGKYDEGTKKYDTLKI